MRLKYIVEKNDKNNELILREYMESDRDKFCLLNEAVFDKKVISSAKTEGSKSLITALRTHNMFPPTIFAEKIAAAVLEVLKSKKNPYMEIVLDDMDFIERKRRIKRKVVRVEDESIEADDIIEDCSDETCTLKFDEEKTEHNEVFPLDDVA